MTAASASRRSSHLQHTIVQESAETEIKIGEITQDLNLKIENA